MHDSVSGITLSLAANCPLGKSADRSGMQGRSVTQILSVIGSETCLMRQRP
ncbi:hypothetical protein [Pantanalinema sp. GBBB05]|uniref:hypothetical protein n=1 Tax=Pantanalinema sp. GBBB05 TaxID=2604139 RepID=UPI003D819094